MSNSSFFEESSVFSTRSNNLGNIKYPEFVYVDTSFARSIHDANSDYRHHCIEFLAEGVNQNSIFIISSKMEEELQHILLRGIYKDKAEELNIESNKQPPWKKLFEQDKSWVSQANEEYRSFMNLLLNSNENITRISYEADEEFTRLRAGLNLCFGFDTADAAHLAIMLTEGYNSIVTLDGGFLDMQNINVYGPTKKIVQASESSNSSLLSYKDNLIPEILDYYEDLINDN